MNINYLLRKDKDRPMTEFPELVETVKFSEAEFQGVRDYMDSIPRWRRDTKHAGNWWGPNDEYVGLATTREQVHVEQLGRPILERLVQILQPKYYVDLNNVEEVVWIPISQLPQ